MKNKMLKGTVLSMISILFFACQPKKEEPVAVDKEQIKNEIQALENKMAEMFNDRNVHAEIYYADDATSFSQNKPPLVGRAAIEKSVREDLAAFPPGYQIAFVVNEIFPSGDGNQVVEIGNYRVSDSTMTALYTGNFIAVFEKRDGKYLCVRDMSASDRPRLEGKKEAPKEEKK